MNKHRSKAPRAPAPPGQVRIIAGQLRNSRLAVPDLATLRPTPERARETLFNWLVPWIKGARVADLYAGTGALGIEALSRGAAEAIFVETDRALADALRANLQRLKVADRARVWAQPALNAIASLDSTIDIVFVDPPFTTDAWLPTLEALRSSAAKRALTYVEWSRTAPPTWPDGLAFEKEGRAGEVCFGLARWVS